MRRRTLLLALAGPAAAQPPPAPGLQAGAAATQGVRRGQVLAFPRDHGAHPDTRTEWWYATGWLGSRDAPLLGFQLTFFRSRTGLAGSEPSRFAARQLLFAHAAVTDLRTRRHLHAQRIARWSGDAASALAAASVADTDIRLAGWTLRRGAAGGYAARLAADDFAIGLLLQPTQPLLLQGDAGFSRKGPAEQQASHYYSEPQLAVQGSVAVTGQPVVTAPVAGESGGSAWLDREWSDAYQPGDAVGWDWIGINLFDGSALMAFQMRRADGSAAWAGGTFRPPGRAPAVFAPEQLQFRAGRIWASPASRARYPVAWQIDTPAGRFGLRALLDAQELDSRGSTGTIYWEGLCELLDDAGRRIGLGYLEMTGYAAPIQLGQ